MKDICQRYSSKLKINLHLLIFSYEEKQFNLELAFNEWKR